MADLPPTAPGAAEAAGRSTTGSAGEDTSVQVDIDTAEEGTGQASEMASVRPNTIIFLLRAIDQSKLNA
jgi:hypothetical protein